MPTHPKMPVLFLGHGSPMHAISKNAFTAALADLGKKIKTPTAILCISAHWLTHGTWITNMRNPKTIHDFYGFPQELFEVSYPAPGSPEAANLVCTEIKNPIIQKDNQDWGIDHGTWSMLLHMYPQANIPVLQLSIDINQDAMYHYKLGTKLARFREQGFLIIGSGNIVHNLKKISWDENAKPYDWAVEFDEWVKSNILSRNFETLYRDMTKSEAGKLSIPTADHYYPLLYALGAADKNDEIIFDFEGIQNASISMRCVRFK